MIVRGWLSLTLLHYVLVLKVQSQHKQPKGIPLSTLPLLSPSHFYELHISTILYGIFLHDISKLSCTCEA